MQKSQIKRIYSTMIKQKLEGFCEEVKPIGKILTQATLEFYDAVSARFHPTPAKTHYTFSLRDISKVQCNLFCHINFCFKFYVSLLKLNRFLQQAAFLKTDAE